MDRSSGEDRIAGRVRDRATANGPPAAPDDGGGGTADDHATMTLAELVRVAAPVALPMTVLWLSCYVGVLAVARRLDPGQMSLVVTCVAVFLVFHAAVVRPPERSRPSAGRASSTGGSAPSVVRARLVGLPAIVLSFGLVALVFDIALSTASALLAAILVAAAASRLRPIEDRAGLAGVVAGGAVRVVAIASVVIAGWGATGVAVGLLLGEIATFVSARLLPSSRTGTRTTSPSALRGIGSPRSIAVAVACLALFAHADLFLARLELPSGSAATYAATSLLVRALLFGAATAMLVLQARSASIPGGDPFRWFQRWIVTTSMGVLVAAVVLVVIRSPVLTIVSRDRAELPSTTFVFVVVGVAVLAIVYQLAHFHAVVDSRTYLISLLGAAIEAAIVAALPATSERIAATTMGTSALILILQYQAGWAITRWSPPLSLLRPHEEVDVADGDARQDEAELSIIVPCHNGGPALAGFLRTLEAEVAHAAAYEIIVVSDGSTDDTLSIARDLASPTLRVVHYPERSGKGHALRVGLARARGRYVGFIDSDGDIDPKAIAPFVSLMRLYEPDVVLGSKRHPMSDVSYPPLRRIMSWVYHKLARLLFRVNVRDTQTGLKVIRREVLTAVLPRMFEKRYAWDLELLVVARMLGFTKVFEAPVRIEYQFSSQVDPNAATRIILDTMAIFYRRYILNSYRHTAHRLAVVRDEQVRA